MLVPAADFRYTSIGADLTISLRALDKYG